MLVGFIIVIREFTSCPLPMKYEGEKAGVIIFLETKLNMWERLREDDTCRNKSSQIGRRAAIVHPCLSACRSAWLVRHGHLYDSLHV